MGKTLSWFTLFVSFLVFTGCQKEVSIGNKDFKELGTSAHDLLSSSLYSSLLIEVNYMPGYAPDSKSIDSLYAFLHKYLNKPDGIKILTRQIRGSNKRALHINDIVLLEKQNRSAFTNGRTLAVSVLIVDAYYTDNELLGISYWNTSFCLFGPSIYESAGGIGQVGRPRLVATLLQHEFGHLLGLVGQGSPAQSAHRDNDNGAHCHNSSCLMYYGIETADNLSGSSAVPVLDANCKADLKANGGK